MAQNDISKTLVSINKNLEKILKAETSSCSDIEDLSKSIKKLLDVPKTEDKIEKILNKQLKLDEGLSKLIREQNEINASIFEQLSRLQEFSSAESYQQHKRFKIELAVSIPAAVSGAIAAIASAISVYLMCA